ncbi:MAG: hypothetical protein BGO77_01905 [Caedibacter sp. 37-49]|nr:MAG: hypothetical protein BGO77_01905 [Caedibacter sp. 37-49]
MTKVSVFPAIKNLLKENVTLYGFVPPDARPPYVVYEERGQTWGFPDVTRGTVSFGLKILSTYKGAQEINQMIALLKGKLEGCEVTLEPRLKGLFRFIHQDTEFKNDAITREAVLEFQLMVRK